MNDTNSDLHPVNVAHLVMGLAFLGLVALWAGIEFANLDQDDLKWLIPLPWLAAGIGGLIAIFAGRRPKASS